MTAAEVLGLVLAVIGLAFAFEAPRSWFLRIIGLRRPKDTVNAPVLVPTQTPPTAHELIADEFAGTTDRSSRSLLTVQEIVDAIHRAPLFQQADLSEHYKGIKVEWDGYLRKAEPDPRDTDYVRVNLIVDKSRIVSHSFWFSIKPERLPEIRTLHRDSRLRVRGTIMAASSAGMSVDVDPEDVVVLERTQQ